MHTYARCVWCVCDERVKGVQISTAKWVWGKVESFVEGGGKSFLNRKSPRILHSGISRDMHANQPLWTKSNYSKPILWSCIIAFSCIFYILHEWIYQALCTHTRIHRGSTHKQKLVSRETVLGYTKAIVAYLNPRPILCAKLNCLRFEYNDLQSDSGSFPHRESKAVLIWISLYPGEVCPLFGLIISIPFPTYSRLMLIHHHNKIESGNCLRVSHR